jgi:hypothetical protein
MALASPNIYSKGAGDKITKASQIWNERWCLLTDPSPIQNDDNGPKKNDFTNSRAICWDDRFSMKQAPSPAFPTPIIF